MAERLNMHRVRAFCDWLSTIEPSPPFFTQSGFRFFRDLTQSEMSAAEQEMRRRGQAAFAEADALALDLGRAVA